MNEHAYVFVGDFESRDAACDYTEPQWEPEPEKGASDQEYEEWEKRNPSWPMRADLGITYLDSDFIETIAGENRFDYLRTLLTEKDEVDRIRALSSDNLNTLVLIFEEALGGFPEEMKSTPRLTFCGRFGWKL